MCFSLFTVAGVAAGGGKVRIGNRAVVAVEVARTDAERVRGLSGREGLGPGAGMLFVYESPVRPAIWMRGMRFSIDILWIRDGRVVDLAKGVRPPAPGEALEVFAPREKAEYVLEVGAGFAERYGVALGDSVEVRLDDGGHQ